MILEWQVFVRDFLNISYTSKYILYTRWLLFNFVFSHILSILPSRAIDDGEAAADEVVLDVNDDERRLRSDDLEFYIELEILVFT